MEEKPKRQRHRPSTKSPGQCQATLPSGERCSATWELANKHKQYCSRCLWRRTQQRHRAKQRAAALAGVEANSTETA